MNIFPQEKFTILSTLGTEEILKRLSENTQPKRLLALPFTNNRYFEGRLKVTHSQYEGPSDIKMVSYRKSRGMSREIL